MLCASILQRIDAKNEQRLSLSSTELTSLSEEISKLLAHKEQNDQHNEIVTDLETQIEMLTNKLSKCKERNQSEMEYLTMTLENRSDELRHVQQQHDENELLLKQTKRDLQKHESQLEEKDSVIRRHEQEIGILKEEVDRLTKKVNTLKGDKEKHNTKIEVEEKQNRIVKFNEDVAVKTFEVEDPTEALEKDMERMRKENDKLKRKLDEVKWQMKAKDIMISNGEDTMEALDNQAEEIETLQDRVEELEEKLRNQNSGEKVEKASMENPKVEEASLDNPEVDILKMKLKEMEMKLRQRDDTIRIMNENKRNDEINNNNQQQKVKIETKEKIIEKIIVQKVETAPEPNSREDEYLQMLITLRDSFFTEMKLQPQVQNGKGHFETVLEDLQKVLGTIRQKVTTVIEESVKENYKEIQRVQSLKKQNTTLKEEIQSKTENYNKTVNSLEVKVNALNTSITIQQQLNDELKEKIGDIEKHRDRIRDESNDLKLKMLIRDSEVERLKGILEDVKKTKKSKKLTKKDKRKSNSLSNLLSG